MIKIYEKNPAYWEYKGEPVLLIGGSGQDNPFQWKKERLLEELDLLVSVGGNYLRNTMSDRDEGNVYAFKKINEGQYDLEKWNSEYWKRLSFFLKETKKRDIIVQLTFWDQHDHIGKWKIHPWNPENNVNYSTEDISSSDDFYSSIKDDNQKILKYQNKYIEKLLSITFDYEHILYNINNESWAGKEWEEYWVKYLKTKAKDNNKELEVTTMHMNAESAIRALIENPDFYSYADISQNNQDAFGKSGQSHMNYILKWRDIVHSFFEKPRPLNNVKIYGAGKGENVSAGTGLEATERFWRNIFGGCASARFHRNEGSWGLGITKRAQKHIKAMNMLSEELNIFECQPHNDLLVQEEEETYSVRRDDNEAYCMANIGSQYAVYFPAGGTIKLDPWIYTDKVKVKWLDIEDNCWSEVEQIKVRWTEKHNIEMKGRIRLVNPNNKPVVALVEVLN